MAEAMNLTDAAIRLLKPWPGQRRRIRALKAQSLFLVVSPFGHKSWMMRLRGPDGRTGKMVLGPFDPSERELQGDPVVGQPLTAAAAHALAATLLRDRALGNDVVAEHKARKLHRRRAIEDIAASSFATAVRDYITEHARLNLRGWHGPNSWSALSSRESLRAVSSRVLPRSYCAVRVPLYRCRACGRTFTPGPRAVRNNAGRV